MRLTGERVYLDMLTREDCRRICELTEFDPDALVEQPCIGFGPERADDWYADIQRRQCDTHVRLGIYVRADDGVRGELVGDVALQDINWRDRRCSVGIGMARLSDRGRGYGTEALKLMLGYGFDALGLERIEARTLDVNKRAQRLLERVGFVREGCERAAVYLGGARRDRLMYGMLRDEWAQVKLECAGGR